MVPGSAVRRLGPALLADDGCVTVADVDWAAFLPAFSASRERPLIHDIPEVAQLTAAATEPDGALATRLRARLATLDGDEREAALVGVVQRHAADVLHYPSPEAVTADKAFRDLGFDSLSAVELRDRLATETGLRLPTTLLFDHPSARAVAGLLRAEMFPDSGEEIDEERAAAIRRALRGIPLARLADSRPHRPAAAARRGPKSGRRDGPGTGHPGFDRLDGRREPAQARSRRSGVARTDRSRSLKWPPPPWRTTSRRCVLL